MTLTRVVGLRRYSPAKRGTMVVSTTLLDSPASLGKTCLILCASENASSIVSPQKAKQTEQCQITTISIVASQIV